MTNEILTTKDVAKTLKLTPRTLRVYLRKINGKAPGVKYEWRSNDAFLKKLPELIAAEKAKDEAKKAAAPAVISVEAKPSEKPVEPGKPPVEAKTPTKPERPAKTAKKKQ
jgi:hypothetical protein